MTDTAQIGYLAINISKYRLTHGTSRVIQTVGRHIGLQSVTTLIIHRSQAIPIKSVIRIGCSLQNLPIGRIISRINYHQSLPWLQGGRELYAVYHKSCIITHIPSMIRLNLTKRIRTRPQWLTQLPGFQIINSHINIIRTCSTT